MSPPTGMFVCDLDGTLRQPDGTIAEVDARALESLAELGVVRVLATGRSLYSLANGVTGALPFDYLVFSTGAGVMELAGRRLLRKRGHAPGDVARAMAVLENLGADYAVYHPVPENHRFRYRKNGEANPDFDWLCERYAEFAEPLSPGTDHTDAAQLLSVAPPDVGVSRTLTVRQALAGLSVVRTTSPTDGESVWIEIFPPDVSKGRTLGWLCGRLGVPAGATASIGNDYNDHDMLEWAAASYVVENAPEELRRSHRSVASFDRGGVAQAVRHWTSR